MRQLLAGLVIGSLIGSVGVTALPVESTFVFIGGCLLEGETATNNNRSERVYYNCGTQAAFNLVKDSRSDLALREAVGKVVDLHYEIVGR